MQKKIVHTQKFGVKILHLLSFVTTKSFFAQGVAQKKKKNSRKPPQTTKFYTLGRGPKTKKKHTQKCRKKRRCAKKETNKKKKDQKVFYIGGFPPYPPLKTRTSSFSLFCSILQGGYPPLSPLHSFKGLSLTLYKLYPFRFSVSLFSGDSSKLPPLFTYSIFCSPLKKKKKKGKKKESRNPTFFTPTKKVAKS